MLRRIERAYQALQTKAPGDSPLARIRPDLAQREHVFSSGAMAASAATADGYAPAAEVYKVYAWVRRAISLKAGALAPLPLRVVDAQGAAVASDLDALLAQPNDRMDSAAFWSICLTHKDLGGEWFAEVVDDARGRPAELWPRRPDMVEIAPDESRPAYPAPAGYQVEGLAGMLPPGNMIHERYLNPLSDWRGLSPAAAVTNDIALDLFALAYAKAFFRNQARPDYAIQTDETLTPDERERLETQIDQKYGSTGARAHRPIVLEAGQSIHPLSFPLKDLAMLELREPNRQAVGAIFGVPDEIMGFGKDTYENFDTALRVLWMLTLLPAVQARDSTLTGFFSRVRPILKPGQRIATDLTSVSVLQEALGPKLEQALRLFQMGVPFDRIDAQLRLGIGPIPGGDIGFVSAGIIPVSEAAMPLPPAPAQRSAEPVTKAASARRTGRALQRIRTTVARRAEREVADWFDALADRVVGRAEKGARVPVTKLPGLDDLIDADDWLSLENLLRSFAVEMVQASWETWNTALDADVSFELSDPAVVAAQRQAGDRITQIADTTREAVRALLIYGAENGWTIGQLVAGTEERPGLRAVVAETYKGRARAIARTELAHAQARATATRYAGAGVSRVTILDNGFDDSDPRCTELNGTVQTLAWYEANPLQHPNCVRAAAPYLED